MSAGAHGSRAAAAAGGDGWCCSRRASGRRRCSRHGLPAWGCALRTQAVAADIQELQRGQVAPILGQPAAQLVGLRQGQAHGPAASSAAARPAAAQGAQRCSAAPQPGGAAACSAARACSPLLMPVGPPCLQPQVHNLRHAAPVGGQRPCRQRRGGGAQVWGTRARAARCRHLPAPTAGDRSPAGPCCWAPAS